MKTIHQRVEEFGITMDWVPAVNNPFMPDMPPGSRHYVCTLQRNGQEMPVYFSMGPAHTKPPSVADVLNALASDAAGVRNYSSVNEWAAAYGYDVSDRKALRNARKSYDAIFAQNRALARLLNEDEMHALLYDTEAL